MKLSSGWLVLGLPAVFGLNAGSAMAAQPRSGRAIARIQPMHMSLYAPRMVIGGLQKIGAISHRMWSSAQARYGAQPQFVAAPPEEPEHSYIASKDLNRSKDAPASAVSAHAALRQMAAGSGAASRSPQRAGFLFDGGYDHGYWGGFNPDAPSRPAVTEEALAAKAAFRLEDALRAAVGESEDAVSIDVSRVPRGRELVLAAKVILNPALSRHSVASAKSAVRKVLEKAPPRYLGFPVLLDIRGQGFKAPASKAKETRAKSLMSPDPEAEVERAHESAFELFGSISGAVARSSGRPGKVEYEVKPRFRKAPILVFKVTISKHGGIGASEARQVIRDLLDRNDLYVPSYRGYPVALKIEESWGVGNADPDEGLPGGGSWAPSYFKMGRI